MAVTPICSINCLAISALGESGIYLVLEIVKKVTGLVLMLLSIRHGIMAFVLTMAFVQGPFGLLINTFVNGRLLNYSFPMQMRDIAPSVALCAISAVAMWGVELVLASVCVALPVKNLVYAVTLATMGGFGFGVYFALAYVFRLRPLAEYCDILLPVMRKRFPRLAERVEAMNWVR